MRFVLAMRFPTPVLEKAMSYCLLHDVGTPLCTDTLAYIYGSLVYAFRDADVLHDRSRFGASEVLRFRVKILRSFALFRRCRSDSRLLYTPTQLLTPKTLVRSGSPCPVLPRDLQGKAGGWRCNSAHSTKCFSHVEGTITFD
jgi:hypothetical protein